MKMKSIKKKKKKNFNTYQNNTNYKFKIKKEISIYKNRLKNLNIFFYYKIIKLMSFNWQIYFKLFFTSLIKNGYKKKLLNFFEKLFFFVKLSGVKNIKLYLTQIFFNIKPIVTFKTLYQSRLTKILLPWHYFSRFWSKKYVSLSINWIKKSINERKEKTLILRIYSEFENIRINQGRTISKKKNFYYSLKKSKTYKYFYNYIKEKC